MIAFKVLFICLQAITVVGQKTQTPPDYLTGVTQRLDVKYGTKVVEYGKSFQRSGKMSFISLNRVL
jgi:hypothetical protein